MAQFDVHRNPRGGNYPFVVDIQSELLARLATRVVVPLLAIKKHGVRPMSRLNPTIKIRGTDYMLVFQELAAIPSSALGEMVTSLAPRRAEIVAALDLLFTGA